MSFQKDEAMPGSWNKLEEAQRVDSNKKRLLLLNSYSDQVSDIQTVSEATALYSSWRINFITSQTTLKTLSQSLAAEKGFMVWYGFYQFRLVIHIPPFWILAAALPDLLMAIWVIPRMAQNRIDNNWYRMMIVAILSLMTVGLGLSALIWRTIKQVTDWDHGTILLYALFMCPQIILRIFTCTENFL